MSRILTDLYFGNICPVARDVNLNSDVGRTMKAISDGEERLLAVLGDAEKSIFLEYIDAWGDLNSTTAMEKFLIGFKLGAKFIDEALKD